MAVFEIVREVPLTARDAFARLTDWERHADVVPFTEITTTPAGFNARTALGPWGFDDPMDVVAWDPPRRCRLEKQGPVVTGWAELEVTPRGTGSLVRWREDLHCRGVPRLFAAVERVAGRALFSRMVDRLLRP